MSEQPEQDAGQAPRPTFLTLSEAADRTGASRSRIRRMLDAGEFPNARQEQAPGKGASAQVWRIPVPDLLAAGLVPNSPRPMPADSRDQASEQDAGQDLSDLRHELDLERERRRSAEALAAERGRALEALEQALRLLEASTTAPAGQASSAPTHETTPREPTHEGQGAQEPAPASLWGRIRRRLS